MKMETADMASGVEDIPPRPRGLVALAKWAWHSWATRSLAIGAVATALDILILLFCVKLFFMPNPVGAMVGVLFGSTFTFFANRHFAFRDHNPKLAPQAAKFVVATLVGMLVHAKFVYIFADRLGVNVVLAKLVADILVFSVGQVLVLRYFVFPKTKPVPAPVEAAAVVAPADGYAALRGEFGSVVDSTARR